MIGKTRLFHKPEGLKSSYLYEPPFAFQPESEETFTLRGPDIGDIKVIIVEVKHNCEITILPCTVSTIETTY